MNFPFKYLFSVGLDSFLQKSTAHAHSPLRPKFRKKEKRKKKAP